MLLVVLIVLLQVPAPPTCAKRVWRFTVVPLESLDTESDPRAEEPAAPEVSTVMSTARPEPDGESAAVWSVVPLARLNPALDAGTTRAPPLA